MVRKKPQAKDKPGKGKTALITGASFGIGEELAACFAAGGFDLVLVARSAGKLEALGKALSEQHQIQVLTAPADMAHQDVARKLALTMLKKQVHVDVLVNNAGILVHGPFIGSSADRLQALIDLNISGLTAMVAQFLPPMVERGGGRILNVASIASFQPVPSLAVYAATKAYVLSLTEALAEELKGTGVTATALCPGITATNMVSGAVEAGSDISRLPGFLIGDAADVARKGYEACIKGHVICVPGVANRAGMIASRATPKWLLRRITGSIGRNILK